MTTDDHETIIAKHLRGAPPPKVPTDREQFWLCVGCAFASGLGLGMGAVSMLWRALCG